jgi:hypothetical protein
VRAPAERVGEARGHAASCTAAVRTTERAYDGRPCPGRPEGGQHARRESATIVGTAGRYAAVGQVSRRCAVVSAQIDGHADLVVMPTWASDPVHGGACRAAQLGIIQDAITVPAPRLSRDRAARRGRRRFVGTSDVSRRNVLHFAAIGAFREVDRPGSHMPPAEQKILSSTKIGKKLFPVHRKVMVSPSVASKVLVRLKLRPLRTCRL